ncbi:MAG: transposase [Frankia sp.]|nr:transposase [Frankia sp.]
MSSGQRAVPFYCPYCGEEDLVPAVPEGSGEGHGHWACRSCRREFRLTLAALASATTATASTTDHPTPAEGNR